MIVHVRNIATTIFVVLTFICVWEADGQRAWGVSLRGGSGTTPTVAFGSDPRLATSVSSSMLGNTLEVVRSEGTMLALGKDVISLPSTKTDGELVVGSDLSSKGVPQWALWSLDTFDTPDSAMWSPNDRAFCGNPGDHFLGGHCLFGATVTQRLYALPQHSRVRVRARVHYFDQWNGESISLLVHGKPVWSQSHDWCPCFLRWMCEKYGVDTCGRDTPDRLSVKAEATFAHSGPTLSLGFNSSLPAGTDPCYQSWGVDDVSVEIM